VALLAAAIFGLNALLCWPLFQVEYLDAFQSNEGALISIGRFLLDHWPHVAWFPWFNGGTPLESAYFPLVPALVAAMAGLARCSPPHAFHFLAALAYSLGPVFLFLFARKVSGRVAPSLAAALAWSLFSPALLIPRFFGDIGTFWGLLRLRTIVYYGETPHNVALSLLPLAWLLLVRYWEAPRPRRFAAAAVVASAIMLSNALGLAVITSSVFLLWLAVDGRTWRRLASTCAVLLVAYLLICRFLHPSLLHEVAVNSQTLGGDYRHWWWAVALLPVWAALWLTLRRVSSVIVRFAALFTGCFGSIVALWLVKGVGLPQAHRYFLEAEAGFCILAAFGLYPLWRRLPVKTAALISIPVLGFVVQADYRSARHWIRPVDISQSVVYRETSWIREHLPDQRVMASGDTQFWFNLFTDNPQIAAGHEAAANWVQRVAVYTIYTGQNAGAQDGPISVLWLKAFGCGAITVPGPGSRDYFHPVIQPGKFAGLLPLLWREGDDFIYQVPLRSPSLAHVVPVKMLVASRPTTGLDVGPLRRYVEALEDTAIPPAQLEWKNSEEGRIVAKVNPGQAVSVQITYDPGWRAAVNGRPVIVRSDGLGMMVIDLDCAGGCTIDLQFSGGLERRICLAVGILTALVLAAMTVLPQFRRRGSGMSHRRHRTLLTKASAVFHALGP
jgi:hypothetical protein